MIKKDYPIKELLSLADVANCVKEHLERAGYSVTTVNKYEIGVTINAIKDKESFIVEAVGENESSDPPREKEILYIIGEIVRRMKKRGMWNFYGIAIPKSYLKLLKDFEVDGVQLLDFHLFVIENSWSLYHLDSKATIELIQNLKAGKPENLIELDIDFKNFDYRL